MCSLFCCVWLARCLGFTDNTPYCCKTWRCKRWNNKKIFPEKYETPLYALEFDTIKPKDDKNYIESFYEFKGREDIKQENNETSINITKIYQHYFIYKKDERTYLDYLQNFTVKSGENCKENYKQCGIFNSEGRILCLPNEEECPLNDFGISNNSLDSNYDNNYKNYEVSDISTNKTYYFYYSNKNINGKIITKFILSNGLPCYSSNEESWISVFTDEIEKNIQCKTKDDDGKDRDNRYFQIPGDGISIKSLYEDNNINITDANSSSIDTIVNLYARNINSKNGNEECIIKYFSDIKEEYNSHQEIETIITVLNIISMLLTFILWIYIIAILFCCCFNLKFYWACLIVHAFGIIVLIVSMSILPEPKLKYNCDESFYLNNQINDINLQVIIKLLLFWAVYPLDFLLLVYYFQYASNYVKKKIMIRKMKINVHQKFKTLYHNLLI